MRGVRGYDENGLADFGELDGDGGAARGFAHAPLAANEDPAEGFLVEDVLKGRL